MFTAAPLPVAGEEHAELRLMALLLSENEIGFAQQSCSKKLEKQAALDDLSRGPGFVNRNLRATCTPGISLPM